MSRFYWWLILSAGFLTGIAFLFQHFFSTPTPSFIAEILVVLIFSTGLIYRYLFRAGKETFIILYFGTMVIKLLAYGAFVLVLIVLDRPGAPANVVFFLAVYTVFVLLEILFLYPKIVR